MNFDKGGRAAIERMVEAYGFTTRQALCDHLGVSKSTLATRYMRDSFPAEWVIQCALETGASLDWLTNGNGPTFNDRQSDIISIPQKKIIDGILYDYNYCMFDKAILGDTFVNPIAVSDGHRIYIFETSFEEVSDGKWLVEIEGKTSIKDLIRIPVGKVKLSNNDSSFECLISDIKAIAKCKSIFIKNI